MNMKKRVFAGIMTAVLLLASAMGVSAAGSRTDDVTTKGTASEGAYVVQDEQNEFATIKNEDASTYALIAGYNAGTKTEAELLASASADVKKALEGKTMITKIFDLDYIGTETKTSHEVTLLVTTLTSSQKNLVVLHYSEVNDKWEVIEPTKVDYDKKEVTVKFNDLSPVAVYADTTTGGSQGTSPSTVGTSSTWMLWMAVAFVAIGAGVVVSQKNKR